MPTSNELTPNEIRALALVNIPRPPGVRHVADTPRVEWYSPNDHVYVCNCAAHCLPINSIYWNHTIRREEWIAWHGAETLRREPSSIMPQIAGDDPGDDEETNFDELVSSNTLRSSEEISLQSDQVEEDMETQSTKQTDKFLCAHCGETKPLSARVAGKLEESRFVGLARSDRLCKRCSGFYYYAIYNTANPRGAETRNSRRWIHGAVSIRLLDTIEVVSQLYASSHCFRTQDNCWFLAEAAAIAHAQQQNRRRTTALQMHRTGNGYIFGYHEVNNVNLFGWPEVTPKDSLCFGVELEMEHVRAIKYANNLSSIDMQKLGVALSAALGGRLDDPKNRFILARDGSLGYSGIELITNPYTLDYHQHTFGWEELLNRAIAAGGCAGAHTTHCGMHVHVNRKAISPLTLGKALIFVNSEKNRALIERIAQRPSNNYTNLRPKKLADGRIGSTAKYEAMHLSDATVEFRIFRGNLRADRVLKNIEFCHSVFGYVANISAQDCQGFKSYLKYVMDNGKLYPHLLAFLREKDSIAIRKGAPQIQITEEI